MANGALSDEQPGSSTLPSSSPPHPHLPRLHLSLHSRPVEQDPTRNMTAQGLDALPTKIFTEGATPSSHRIGTHAGCPPRIFPHLVWPSWPPVVLAGRFFFFFFCDPDDAFSSWSSISSSAAASSSTSSSSPSSMSSSSSSSLSS